MAQVEEYYEEDEYEEEEDGEGDEGEEDDDYEEVDAEELAAASTGATALRCCMRPASLSVQRWWPNCRDPHGSGRAPALCGRTRCPCTACTAWQS